MPTKKVLKGLGLTDSESEIYIALLELGSTTAGPIIKKSGLHRGTTYGILQRLIEKGLVKYVIKGADRYFEATDPEMFLDILKEKEAQLRKVLPIMQQKKLFAKESQKTFVYEGDAGVKVVYDMIAKELNTGDVHLVFGAPAGRPDFWIEYFEKFSNTLKQKGVTERIIFNEDARESIMQSKERLQFVRVLPKEFITPTSVDIFNNKTAFVIWTKKPVAFVIENKEFANSFRHYFELLWSIAKEV